MVKIHVLVFLFLLAFSVNAQPTDAPADTAQFERLDACFVALPAGYFENNKAACGYVIVPENPTDPTNTNQMKIAVIVIHPLRVEPKPDPVIFINGGPGAETLSVLNSQILPIFGRPILATGRSIILFDPRGVGFSEPTLNCPQRDGLPVLDDVIAATTECLETLKTTHDFTVYHSAAIAADIDAIAEALDYEQVNLWGSSYGTRMALTTMRDFPQRVRAAILDSVVPLDTFSLQDYPALFEALFADCAAHAVCNDNFPDLKTVFLELVARFHAEPVAYQSSQDTDPIWIDDYIFVNVILKMIDNTSQLSSVPAAIYAVYNGDMSQIEANLGYATVFPRGNVMGQVVDCNDRKPFETAEMFEVWYTSVSDYVGLEVTIPQNQVEPCSIGEYRNPPLVENEPLTSDIPNLLLNGEYDARTPAAFALHAAETLPNSFTYVLPYTGHAAISVGGCVIDIMQDFLDDPTSEPASASGCISLLEQRFQWASGR